MNARNVQVIPVKQEKYIFKIYDEDTSKCYYIFSIWKDNNDDINVKLKISDLVNIWEVEISNSKVQEFVNESGLAYENYVKLCKNALLGNKNNEYKYRMKSHNKDLFLQWSKCVDNNMQYQLGSIVLSNRKINNSKLCEIDIAQEFIENLILQSQELTNYINKITSDKQHGSLIENDNHLYIKFAMILNEKKNKIRELNDLLNHKNQSSIASNTSKLKPSITTVHKAKKRIKKPIAKFGRGVNYDPLDVSDQNDYVLPKLPIKKHNKNMLKASDNSEDEKPHERAHESYSESSNSIYSDINHDSSEVDLVLSNENIRFEPNHKNFNIKSTKTTPKLRTVTLKSPKCKRSTPLNIQKDSSKGSPLNTTDSEQTPSKSSKKRKIPSMPVKRLKTKSFPKHKSSTSGSFQKDDGKSPHTSESDQTISTSFRKYITPSVPIKRLKKNSNKNKLLSSTDKKSSKDKKLLSSADQSQGLYTDLDELIGF